MRSLARALVSPHAPPTVVVVAAVRRATTFDFHEARRSSTIAVVDLLSMSNVSAQRRTKVRRVNERRHRGSIDSKAAAVAPFHSLSHAPAHFDNDEPCRASPRFKRPPCAAAPHQAIRRHAAAAATTRKPLDEDARASCRLQSRQSSLTQHREIHTSRGDRVERRDPKIRNERQLAATSSIEGQQEVMLQHDDDQKATCHGVDIKRQQTSCAKKLCAQSRLCK